MNRPNQFGTPLKKICSANILSGSDVYFESDLSCSAKAEGYHSSHLRLLFEQVDGGPRDVRVGSEPRSPDQKGRERSEEVFETGTPRRRPFSALVETTPTGPLALLCTYACTLLSVPSENAITLFVSLAFLLFSYFSVMRLAKMIT